MAKSILKLCLTVITSVLLVSNVMAQQEETQAQESKGSDLATATAAQDAAPKKSSATTAPTSSGFITLETTIVGNKEQPKVLSIVPWQNPEQAGSLSTEITTQIEQVFRPLDSEILQREIVYFKQSQQ